MSMTDSFGIYIHIPFCPVQCDFCAFDTHPLDQTLISPYLKALSKELGQHAHHPLLEKRRVSSIYFGGGTPSVLSPEAIHRMILKVQKCFNTTPIPEITLEAHPMTVDGKKLQGFHEAGISRLSLGFQSLYNEDLLTLNRQHSAHRFHGIFQAARKAGFHNINCDLIFGLPDQRFSDWQKSLETALGLGPDHLSLYALTVEEGTYLQSAIEMGKTSYPKEEDQLKMYNWACERLEHSGIFQYEISNFSKPGFESTHNLLYWKRSDYIGLGCSAHSSLGGDRYSNLYTPQAYINSMEQVGEALLEKETLSTEKRFMEALVFGLRQTKGVSLHHLEKRFSFSTPTPVWNSFYKLQNKRLISFLEGNDGGIQLTQTGIHVADEVSQQLLAGFHDSN